MPEDTRTDYIAGQVHGLIAFALAVISSHHDPANLEAHLASVSFAAGARAGAEPVSEDFLEGMEDVAGRLRKIAEKARLRKGAPRTHPD